MLPHLFRPWKIYPNLAVLALGKGTARGLQNDIKMTFYA